MVRAAVLERDLPGVPVSVGAGNTIVWAEGFGWRDVDTQTSVTPSTRFNIGTAARALTPAAVASLGLTNTGAESAEQWSPERIGEPEEDLRSSPSSATSSSGRSVCRWRSHCAAIARPSTFHDPLITIPAGAED